MVDRRLDVRARGRGSRVAVNVNRDVGFWEQRAYASVPGIAERASSRIAVCDLIRMTCNLHYLLHLTRILTCTPAPLAAS
eukprot:3023770-Rhodomonas_salina.1